jgi:voltage-gated potassium channel
MLRILLLFLRRLWLPLVVFAGFSLMCVLVYRRLEGLSWQDALFWMIQPHAIDPKHVRNATKMFSLFVYMGVFAFQIWVAERVAVTIFHRQGMEVWRTMVNDVSIEKLQDHFIICGYGQVGRTVGRPTEPSQDPLCAHRNQ